MVSYSIFKLAYKRKNWNLIVISMQRVWIQQKKDGFGKR